MSGGDFEDELRVWDVATARVQGRVQRRARVSGPSPSVRTGRGSPRDSYDPEAGHTMSVCDVATGERWSRPGAGRPCLQPRRPLAGRPGRGREDRAPLGCADLPTRRPLAGTHGRGSTRSPSVPTAAASPRRAATAPSACGTTATGQCLRVLRGAHRRGLRGGLPPRRHAPGHGRPRPGRLAVGPGAAARRWRGCPGTPATSGRWPSAPTARRWSPAPATPPSACGTPRRCRCATRRAARPRPCGPRPNGWSSSCCGRRRTRPRSWRPCADDFVESSHCARRCASCYTGDRSSEGKTLFLRESATASRSRFGLVWNFRARVIYSPATGKPEVTARPVAAWRVSARRLVGRLFAISNYRILPTWYGTTHRINNLSKYIKTIPSF